MSYLIFCNLCYINKSCIFLQCGCMFCENCFKTIISNKNNNKFNCPICKKDININNLLNLKKKEDIKKISFIFNDTEKELKKVMQNLSFQRSATNKYINFLENKVNFLLKENSELKNLNNSLIENQNNINNNSLNDSNYEYNTTNSRTRNSNQFLDITQIKKIEPKSRKRSSNKANQLTPITFRNEKINNLNVQTASEQTNEKMNVLNININNPSTNNLNDNNLNYLKTPYNNKNNNYNYSVNNINPNQIYNNNSFYQSNNNINKSYNNYNHNNNINSFYKV